MFGHQRIQILDLGTHVLKACVASCKNDGQLVVESAWAQRLDTVSLRLEDYLETGRPALEALSKQAFRRGDPVHVIPGDSVIRSEVHTLPGVPEDGVPKILVTSRHQFVSSFSTRVPIFEKSFPIHIRRVEDQVHVTAVHAFCRRQDVASIHQWLARARLKPGAILSPLLALAEVVGGLLERWPAHEDPPQLFLDLGASSTSVLALDGPSVAAYRKVYGGCADWLRGLGERVPEIGAETMMAVSDRLYGAGLDALPAALAGDGWDDDVGDRVHRLVVRSWDRLLDAVDQILPALLSDPGAEDLEEFDLEPEPGEPPAAGPEGPILTGGGGAALEGLAARIEQKIQQSCRPVDPFAALGIGAPGSLPLPASSLIPCVGALAVVTRLGTQTADLAEMLVVAGARDAAAEVSFVRTMARPAAFGGAVGAFVLFITLIAGWVIDSRSDEMARTIEAESASMPSATAIQETLMAYRDLRSREAAIDARFAYIERLLDHRVSWPRIFKGLQQALPEDLCRITGVEVQSSWPNIVPGGESHHQRSKVVMFKLRGVARSLTGVTQFVEALKRVPFFKDPHIGGSSAGPPGHAPQTTAKFSYGFEISGEIEDVRSQAD